MFVLMTVYLLKNASVFLSTTVYVLRHVSVFEDNSVLVKACLCVCRQLCISVKCVSTLVNNSVLVKDYSLYSILVYV